MIGVYLIDSIKLKTSGFDQWGEPINPVEVTVKGRFEFKTEVVRDVTGQEVVSAGHVILKDRALGYDTKIEYDSKEYSILNIQRLRDFDNKYLKVFLK